MAALDQPPLESSTEPADAFIYELLEYNREPLLVVLDDLHLICEGEWLVPFLCRLLPLLPRKVHFLITSRHAAGAAMAHEIKANAPGDR